MSLKEKLLKIIVDITIELFNIVEILLAVNSSFHPQI